MTANGRAKRLDSKFAFIGGWFSVALEHDPFPFKLSALEVEKHTYFQAAFFRRSHAPVLEILISYPSHGDCFLYRDLCPI